MNITRFGLFLYTVVVLFFGFAIGFSSPHSPRNIEIQKSVQLEQEIRDRIELLLTVRGLILCESSWNKNAIGDKGKSFGLGQFQYQTFEWLKNKANMSKLKWKDPHDQITLLIWAVENDFINLWTCSKQVTKVDNR